jgi:hypothetical protein
MWMTLPKQKETLPKPRFIEFKNFILGLFKRRVFLYFWLIGALALLVPIFLPKFFPSIVLGVLILLAGFVWTAFLDHRDLLRAYQGAVVTVPVEKNKRSGVAISFVPEIEYKYSIADPYAGQNLHISRMQNNKDLKCRFDERGIFFINGEVYYLMARGGLEINFQLFNSEDVPLDILSIYVDDNLELNHLRVYLDGVYLRGNKVRFPLRLKKGEFLTLQSRHTISLGIGSTDALFAADMRSLPISILYDVIVNTSNDKGKRQSYVAELSTPSQTLVDLYVNQWREYGQHEYLVLAGHEQTGDPDSTHSD